MKKLLAVLLVLTLSLGLSSALAAETIIIGATSTPHAEVLEYVREDLVALGYDLDIRIVTDYPISNPATAAGDMMANYFQHMAYLNAYNREVPEQEQLVAAISTHYEPYGIYAGTKSSLEDIADGDSIVITNDPSNEARALLLLQECGYITLPEGSGLDSELTVLDIIDNPKKLNIVEMNAELIPAALDDVSFAIINGNYAIDAGLKPGSDALRLEDPQGESGQLLVNYVVIRPADADAPWVEALRTVLQSEKVKDYMNTNEKYAQGVIPVF